MSRRNQDRNDSRGAQGVHPSSGISHAQGVHRQNTGNHQARPGRWKRAKKNNDSSRHQHHSYPPHRHHENRRSEHSYAGSSTSQSSTPVQTTTPEPSTPSQDPAVREIPGFYFDPEKKKYFRITENHVFGSQYAYSQQSIKEKTKVKPKVEPIKKRPLQRFPSPVSHYGRLGWFLQDSQLGLVGGPRRQLCMVHSMVAKTWRKRECSAPLFTRSECEYTHMMFDHARQELYLASSQGDLWRYYIEADPVGVGSRIEMNTLESSATTSLHLRSDDLLVTTHLGSEARPGILKMYRRSEDLRLYPLIPVLEYSLSKSNIWCSDLDSDKVAIGGDRKLVLLREWNTGRNLVQTIRTASDVFSVQIEPLEQRNIVYAGCRDGYVQIFDMNRPIPSAGPKEGDRKRASILDGIGHKQSPVNCMKRVSHHYLVTSAMNGEILMWDTRFVGGHSSSSSGATAKPVLDIREPLHNFFAKTSFDVNIDETLLAARQGNDQVSIWSLSTGDRIRDLEVSGPVGCFSFSTTSQGIWTVAKDQLEFSGDSSA